MTPTLTLPLPAFAIHRLPRRYAPILMALILSTAICAVTSGMITAINTGLDAGYLERWLRAYALAWAFAFPTVALVSPHLRRWIAALTD